MSASAATHRAARGAGWSPAGAQPAQDVPVLPDLGALPLQIRITRLPSLHSLQNDCLNCFTAGRVGWKEVLGLNKLSAELLLASNCEVQTGGTAPAALRCSPGHFCASDHSSAQAATCAPTGLNPALSQDIFTQRLASMSSLAETKFPSFLSVTEFPGSYPKTRIHPRILKSLQEISTSLLLHAALHIAHIVVPLYTHESLYCPAPKTSPGWSFSHGYFRESKAELSTEKRE